MPESPSPNIVIAGIDNTSLATYGKWSEWQRRLHAQAINNLHEAGAKVIAFDILFADSSVDDGILAQAIETAGNVVLTVVGDKPLPPSQSGFSYEYFIVPTTPLEQACLSLGHANVVPDGDGVVRRIPLIVKDSSGYTYPAFALAVLHALFSQPLPGEYSLQNSKLSLLGRDVPVDKYNRVRINFTASKNSYTTLSYSAIIAGDFDPAIVKHKAVLIGMTATGEPDTWPTPISASKMPGVWIHANVMDTILRQRFLIDADWLTNLMIMLLLIAITGFAFPRMKLKWSGALTAGLFACYLLVVFITFNSGYVINILFPLMLLPVAYITNVFCVVVAEQYDKRLIKDLFGKYVSHQVATEIIDLNAVGMLELGGEHRTVTVMFSDIRGFTKMSEQMSPKEVVDILNTYLSIIIERVLDNDGMINKFAGDNIMAVWNAPQYQEEHARLAIKAAWEAQQAIMERQKSDSSLPPVQFGIGINTGEAVAGNIGSSGRAEYTVIGDSVNLASRICGATPGGEVWIGQETYRHAADYVDIEELEPQSFKGKTEPVTVYKMVGLR